MAGSYAAPILIMTGLSFADHWYANNQIDLKIPVAGGVAYLIAALASEIPDVAPVVTGIAWVALAAAIVVPLASGGQSILTPLLSVANGV
jgi:hypothetical protein